MAVLGLEYHEMYLTIISICKEHLQLCEVVLRKAVSGSLYRKSEKSIKIKCKYGQKKLGTTFWFLGITLYFNTDGMTLKGDCAQMFEKDSELTIFA